MDSKGKRVQLSSSRLAEIFLNTIHNLQQLGEQKGRIQLEREPRRGVQVVKWLLQLWRGRGVRGCLLCRVSGSYCTTHMCACDEIHGWHQIIIAPHMVPCIC